ncbi:type IV pilus biogenesis/stability protein PilW [Erwinia sp. SLM-02]|uniref:type IV pilus biogenesis/stability protein PilW n=1 Tax=Erwinia sp. SLM-02 TaxID=3020057 RepID=UPI0028D291CE|nr:type IV pilus biogenesis/stability protein PilW [uncultured Erwinia sp.]
MHIRMMAAAVLLLAGCQSAQRNDALVETRLQLGLAYLARGELDAAQRNLQRALAMAPNDYRTQLAEARFQQQVGDNTLAAEYYHRALTLAPQNGYVLNNYGAFLCRLGQYDAAQRYFIQAAEDSANAARADSVENSGYCYLNAGERNKAHDALVEAVTADPAKGMPMLAEAERRFGKGKRDDSRILLEIYQHNFPVSAESLWLEIRFAVQEGRTADVKHYGGQLARIFPQSIQYQHFLANEY